MALLANAQMTVASAPGTGTVTLNAATPGAQAWAAAGALDGASYSYRIEEGASWEVGTGTYAASGPTLARTKVLASSAASNALVNFGAGAIVSQVALPADLALGLRNRIVNPGMRVAQERGTTAVSISGSTGATLCDVFAVSFNSGNGGVVSGAQVAARTPGGSPNRLRLTVTTASASLAAGDLVLIQSLIEGQDLTDLLLGTASAKPLTVRFGVNMPAGTYAASLRNGASNRSYVVPFTIAAGQAGADQLVSFTVPGDVTGTWPSDNTYGLSLGVCIAAGTTYQTSPAAWQAGNYFSTSAVSNGLATANAVFDLFDVGLYDGPTAPPFTLQSYARDLAETQRLFEAGASRYFGFGKTGVPQGVNTSFAVTKRISPVMKLVCIENYNIPSGDPAQNVMSRVGSFSYTHTPTNADGQTIFQDTWTADAR